MQSIVLTRDSFLKKDAHTASHEDGEIKKKKPVFFSNPSLQERFEQTTKMQGAAAKSHAHGAGGKASRDDRRAKYEVSSDHDDDDEEPDVKARPTKDVTVKRKAPVKGASLDAKGKKAARGNSDGSDSSAPSEVEVINGRIVAKKKHRKVGSAAGTAPRFRRRAIEPPSSSGEESEGGSRDKAKRKQPKQKIPVGGAKFAHTTTAAASDSQAAKRSAKGNGKRRGNAIKQDRPDTDDETDQLKSSSDVSVSPVKKSAYDRKGKGKGKATVRSAEEQSDLAKKVQISPARFFSKTSVASRQLDAPNVLAPTTDSRSRGRSGSSSSSFSSPDASDASLDLPTLPNGVENLLDLTIEERDRLRKAQRKALRRDKVLYAKRAANAQSIRSKAKQSFVKPDFAASGDGSGGNGTAADKGKSAHRSWGDLIKGSNGTEPHTFGKGSPPGNHTSQGGAVAGPSRGTTWTCGACTLVVSQF